jgi:hypothetical protein
MVNGRILLHTVSVTLIVILVLSCASNTVIPLPSTPEQKLFVIMSLDPGNTLKYCAHGSGNAFEGVLQEATEDSMYLWCNDAEISIGTGEIDSLWVRQRSVESGIKTGAIIGWSAVTGYAILTIVYIDATDDRNYANLLLAPLIGVVGAIGGGGVGACAGAAVTRWERLF